MLLFNLRRKKTDSEKTKKETPEEKADNILFVPTLAEKENEAGEIPEVLDLIKAELLKKAIAHELPNLPEDEIIDISGLNNIEELPEEITHLEEVNKHGIPVKTKIKKRTFKKKKGDKLEITKVKTTETEGESPKTVVTVDEKDKDDTEYQQVGVPLSELPEDIEVIDITTTDKVPKKSYKKENIT